MQLFQTLEDISTIAPISISPTLSSFFYVEEDLQQQMSTVAQIEELLRIM